MNKYENVIIYFEIVVKNCLEIKFENTNNPTETNIE